MSTYNSEGIGGWSPPADDHKYAHSYGYLKAAVGEFLAGHLTKEQLAAFAETAEEDLHLDEEKAP